MHAGKRIIKTNIWKFWRIFYNIAHLFIHINFYKRVHLLLWIIRLHKFAYLIATIYNFKTQLLKENLQNTTTKYIH